MIVHRSPWPLAILVEHNDQGWIAAHLAAHSLIRDLIRACALV